MSYRLSKVAILYILFLLKIVVFSPMLLINKGLFFDQTKWYSTQKKRLFQMAYFKIHEKIIEKVQNWQLQR